MTFLSTVLRDGLMYVSPAYSCLIFKVSTTDLCWNEEMSSKIWVIIICKRRVSTESNRKKRHSSVHFCISASSCRNWFRYCATSWCLLGELTRSSRENVIDQTLLQMKWKDDVTCSSFSSWYLSFSDCNWAEINLEPLIPAVSAPVEDIFWSEVTKFGTHFSLKNSSHPREDSTVLVFSWCSDNQAFPLFLGLFPWQALRWYGFLHLLHFMTTFPSLPLSL